MKQERLEQLDALPQLQSKSVAGMRLYKLPTGRWVPSVTTIVGYEKEEFFKQWRKRVGPIEAKEGVNRGQYMHDLIEAHILGTGEKPKAVNPLAEMIGANLFKVMVPELNRISSVHTTEQPLYSETLCCAGRCDAVVSYEGEMQILDFKTAKQPKPEKWLRNYYLQVSAYIYMINELTDLNINRGHVFIACETGEFQKVTVEPKKYYDELAKEIMGFIKHKTGIANVKHTR